MRPPNRLLRDIKLTAFLQHQSTWRHGPLAYMASVRLPFRDRQCLLSGPIPPRHCYSCALGSADSKLYHRLFWSKAEQPILPTNKKESNDASRPDRGVIIGNNPSTYPSRLLIYFAGRRTVWLACLKLSTLFLSAFAVFVIAPAWYWEVVDPEGAAAARAAAATAASGASIDQREGQQEEPKPLTVTLPNNRGKDEEITNGAPTSPITRAVTLHLPPWLSNTTDNTITIPAQTAAVLTATSIAFLGSIPLILMQYFSSPYVTHMHIHLPSHARFSSHYLRRFLTNLPPETTVDLTTLRLIGRPYKQLTQIPISHLRKETRRLGCANLVWRGHDNSKRGKDKMVEKLFFIDERGSPAVSGDGGIGAAEMVMKKLGEWTEKGVPVMEEEGVAGAERKRGNEKMKDVKDVKNVRLRRG